MSRVDNEIRNKAYEQALKTYATHSLTQLERLREDIRISDLMIEGKKNAIQKLISDQVDGRS